jgi:UTP-glucose-1-phosphate uridylyltransferase
VSIIEKPAREQEPSDIVTLSFHYYSKPQEIFALIAKQNGGDDAYERALDELMKSRKVKMFPAI